MSKLKTVVLEAFDLDDAWFQCLDRIIDEGHVYTITRGSFAGQKRLEFDNFMIEITNPGHQIIPLIPEGMQIPPPTSMEYINGYLEYLVTEQKKENEDYTYGERLVNPKVKIDDKMIPLNVNQILTVIDMYKKGGHGTNQACMEIAMPSDILLTDPPCVTPDTLILTKKGLKKAEDIVIGDKVLTHKGNWKPVTKVYKRRYVGKLHTIQIKGFKHKLTLTPEHPVYAIKVSKCPYDNPLRCKPNCKKRYSVYEKHNRHCPTIFKNYKNEWIEAKNLTSLSYIIIPKIKGATKTTFTDDHMYLFGLFLAEGDYNKEDAIRFNLGAHESVLIKRVIELMKKLYKLDPHFDNSGQGSTRIVFYSRILVKKFKKMFGGGARNKSTPFKFLFFNKTKLLNLINGYIAGDGHIRNESELEFYTSSKKLAETFKLILNKIGIIPSVSETIPKGGVINGRRIKSNGKGHHFFITKNKQREKYWEEGNNYYIPAHSNEVCNYEGHVFNYEVEDDNSYIANGIPVHNCLRLVDTRIRYGKLHFFVYFRSWDLYSGFPSNLGGLQKVKEWMAEEIGVKDGEIVAYSKGLHLYDHCWQYAGIRTNKLDKINKLSGK